MPDTFASFSPSLESPATQVIAVTPDDALDIPFVSRAINVATNGSVRVTTLGGDTATVFVAAGVTFPIRATRIWATGTTATDIVVMY